MFTIETLAQPTESDLSGLGELMRDSVASGASVNFVQVPESAAATDWWRNALSDTSCELIVARDEAERIVGCVRLMPASQPNGQHRADIGKLLVHSEYRNQGIASALMSAVEELARKQGRWLLLLDTETGSYAEKFYAKQGWTEFGRVPDHTVDQKGELSSTTYFRKDLRVAAIPNGQSLFTAFGLALAAGLSAKLPVLFGLDVFAQGDFYARNLGLVVLPWIAILFAWAHQERTRTLLYIAGATVGAALFMNLFPFAANSQTLLISAVALPITAWFAIGAIRASSSWKTTSARLSFVRLTSEAVFFYALLALSGGVLLAIGFALFEGKSEVASTVLNDWILVCGAAGAVVVAVALADSRGRGMQSVVSMVQRIFTPLFTFMMLAYAVTAIPAGFLASFQRNTLLVFDLLLGVVTLLTAFRISDRQDDGRFNLHDWMLLVMTSVGVVVDFMALAAIVTRLTTEGWSPNRIAVLTLNLVLLVFLIGCARLLLQSQRQQTGMTRVQNWLGKYFTVFAAWSGLMAIGLPLLFAGK